MPAKASPRGHDDSAGNHPLRCSGLVLMGLLHGLGLGGRNLDSRPADHRAVDYSYMIRAVLVSFAFFLFATAARAETNQNGTPEPKDAQPHPVGKPVTTTIIKRCPEGYEPVTRYNGQHACARDFLPLNEPTDGFR